MEEVKIYAMLLERQDALFMNVQAAYCLEDAFQMARLDFEKVNPGLPKQNFKITVFDVKRIDELFKDPKVESFMKRTREIPMEVPLVPEAKERVLSSQEIIEKSIARKKNHIMKTISENKDEKMFRENKPFFTEAEKQFLRSKLKPLDK